MTSNCIASYGYLGRRRPWSTQGQRILHLLRSSSNQHDILTLDSKLLSPKKIAQLPHTVHSYPLKNSLNHQMHHYLVDLSVTQL